jgi:hypothetical protein
MTVIRITFDATHISRKRWEIFVKHMKHPENNTGFQTSFTEWQNAAKTLPNMDEDIFNNCI